MKQWGKDERINRIRIRSGKRQRHYYEISGLIGDYLGNLIYSYVPELSINIPILGATHITSYFPNLGHDVGKNIGVGIGGTIESIVNKVPVIGSVLNKLIGN